MLNDVFTRDIYKDSALEKVKEFLLTYCSILRFENGIRAMPEFNHKWGMKVLKVHQMRKRRREFLGEVFARETEIMSNHYSHKKKTASNKKILLKLAGIKPHNVKNILDDYFYKVCNEFFKRQMQIWILL